ncbi:regulator of nonsense transcripts UPF3 isoform X1 [Gossypium hirsutum]|uniref:Regulator of nonsense transcripts UPF3 isoform X1 n=1 Tax=Gossypium hirsutum TaxID=3635 RepID=A0A1U8MK57_GOSHI|nr:regulator of nonsense transcripts UPF3 isoform X1 [Gossypium hirsutum]
MKRTLDRTKVVLRHLPPSITETMLMEQVDSAFAGRYNWFSFSPGKNRQKHQSCSRLYIDFKSPEDVLEFAEFFNGHVFVNEKDPEYLEFLEFLAKPVENLPSAEIQLERREAERVGALKDSSIVTPLMDFVRRKRAAKVGSRKSLSNGKLSRRAGGQSGGIPSSASSKRGSEKRRGSTTMYVLRDSLKNASGKDKSTYILVSRRDEQQLSNKPVILASSVGTEVSEEESGATRITDADKNKVLLLKGKGKEKEKEISHVAGSILHQQNFTSPIKTILRSTPTKLNSRRENRIIRGILLNKDSRQSQCPGFQSEQHIETSNLKKERRPPWHPQANLGLKDACNASDGNVAGNHLHGAKKLERRSRNKDRTDHGVWTLRHSDGSCASDESLPSSASQSAQILIDSSEVSSSNSRLQKTELYFIKNNFGVPFSENCPGACGDTKVDFSSVGSCKGKTFASEHNGSSKHISRRVAVANGSSAVNDGKPGKRANVYGSHEKQVWVQKSSSGS